MYTCTCIIIIMCYTCRYACSWRRLSPSTDGVSGESKDLWIFYFTILPDLSGKLASELKGSYVNKSKVLCTCTCVHVHA